MEPWLSNERITVTSQFARAEAQARIPQNEKGKA